jgi:diketogulonate reductase-like aldo/keto reductase
VGGPSDADYEVIEAVASIAASLGVSSSAVALAWLRGRPGSVIPIVGARRSDHLLDNLTALEVTLTSDQLATLDAVSAPSLDYPAPMHGAARAMLQFAGTTVDGESSGIYPPLLESDVRY